MALSYDFQFLSDKLLSLGAICSAAELQGMYCGLLAGGQSWVNRYCPLTSAR